MGAPLDQEFIDNLNGHLGIAHKIARLYFKDSAERDDVIQEMMYQLWKSYPAFGARAKFSTWMYSVCLNTALTHVRKNTRKAHEPLTSAHEQIGQSGPENKEAALDLLFEAIATLSELNKAVVLLYLERMSYDEIAVVTGLSKANVSVRLVRIKNELEEKLRPKLNSIDHDLA